MIAYLLLIILVKIINGDDISDTKYIETLPASVKQGLLDKIARRILNEVPEVKSRNSDVNGDSLADKLEEQSEFVKRILRQEVESLKARRYQKHKKLRKSGNYNDKLSGISGSEAIERNDTEISELNEKALVSDKIDADAGHIDLTMRSARSKRGDSFSNLNRTTLKRGLPVDEHLSGADFIPVTIDIDTGTDDKKIVNDTNKNTKGVFKEQKSSEDDIQIKRPKHGKQKKRNNDNTEIPDINYENADSITEISTKNYAKSETSKIENSSVKMYLGRISEHLDLNKTEELVNITPADANTIPESPNINSDDTQTLDDNATTSKTFDTTAVAVKGISLETDEDTKNKTDFMSKYSSESHLENPMNVNEGRKNLEVLNSDETTTQKIEETSVESTSEMNDTGALVTEKSHNNYSEITSLNMITTETSYTATTVKIQASEEKNTNVSTDVGTDYKVTNKNNEEGNVVTETEIPNVTQADITTISKKVGNSSKRADENDTKTNNKKPCNETDVKVGVVTDCDKKQNQTVNYTLKTSSVISKIHDKPKVNTTIDTVLNESKNTLQNDIRNETSSKLGAVTDCNTKINQTDNPTTEIPNVTEANINKPTVNAVVDKIETESKSTLRTGNQKPMYDSPIHFGDMQIKEEYEVFEVESGKPAFLKQNERHNNDRSIEQPRYAPVYNYDPQNAYFNAYNRLGPNENDDDDSSATSDPGNEHVIRTPTLRMSRIDKKHKKKYQSISEEVENTTKAYYSSEYKENEKNSDASNEDIFGGLSDEDGHINNPYIKTHLNHVRHTNYKNKIFGYVPTHHERKKTLAKQVKYLYNNVLGKSTEEILDESKEGEMKWKEKQIHLRINDDGRYDERLDASEDIREHTRKDAKEDKKVEVVVIDMNEGGRSILRQGGYFSSKYKWDEEGNSFTNKGKVYNLDHIVPYSTEKSIILEQKKESNKIFDRIRNFGKPSADNSAEALSRPNPEDVKKAIEHLKNIDMSKTLFDKSYVDKLEKGIEINTHPSVPPLNPRHFQYLKQRPVQSRHKGEIQNHHEILRSKPCNKRPNCEFQLYGLLRIETTTERAKYKAPNDVLNSIHKITQITPEVDMLQNVESMLQINDFPIVRSRDNAVKLYMRILRDMVKMDNKALEDYDWLGTTVAIQSALAKLKEIIYLEKKNKHIHPSDLQLYKYVEAIYSKASEVTKEKEGETLDEHIRGLKLDRKANDERMSLPKTHRKIKYPLKILQQISDLLNKKVLRDKAVNKAKNLEVFLDSMQQCLDDFHTAIKELTRITKYNQQRWYRNIKELYLSARGEKEYLEVLLHLYSMKLFGLIEDSAGKGVEVNYRMYMKENGFEVDRAQAEMVYVIRLLKTIHDLRVN